MEGGPHHHEGRLLDPGEGQHAAPLQPEAPRHMARVVPPARRSVHLHAGTPQGGIDQHGINATSLRLCKAAPDLACVMHIPTPSTSRAA